MLYYGLSQVSSKDLQVNHSQVNERQKLFSMIEMVLLGVLSAWRVEFEGPKGLVFLKAERSFNVTKGITPLDSIPSQAVIVLADGNEVAHEGLDNLNIRHGPLESGGLWLVRGTNRYLVHANVVIFSSPFETNCAWGPCLLVNFASKTLDP